MRNFASSGLLVITLGAALAACGDDGLGLGDGGGGSGGTGGGDSGAGARDGGTGDGNGARRYRWILITDNETSPMCTSTGPGADIDSVTLIRGGLAMGVGLKGSAMTGEALPGTSTSPCTNCGAAMMMCPYSGSGAAARVEGPRDGRSVAVGMDMGYVALNAGVVWLQIGTSTGEAPAQDILPGDTVKVWEIDKGYIADGFAPSTCGCNAEKYSAWAYVDKTDMTTRVQLTPSAFLQANSAECGASPASGSTLGCGTTDFRVPQ